MTNTIPTKCSAKDRSTCRYHGALDHATMDLTAAKENYEKVLAANTEENADPAFARKRASNISKAENKVWVAQAQYDALPAQYRQLEKELDEAKKNLDVAKARPLQDRVIYAKRVLRDKKHAVAAEKAKQDSEKAIANQMSLNQKAFEAWKQSDAFKANQELPAWKQEIRRTVGAKVVHNGAFATQIKNYETGRISFSSRGAGRHTYDIISAYKPHVANCGVFTTGPIKEEVDVYIESGYYGEEGAGSNKTVGCDVTCNCGKVFQAPAEADGETLHEMLATYDESNRSFGI